MRWPGMALNFQSSRLNFIISLGTTVMCHHVWHGLCVRYMQPYACVLEARGRRWMFSSITLHYSFETGSLPGPGAHSFCGAGWPARPTDTRVFIPDSTGLQAHVRLKSPVCAASSLTHGVISPAHTASLYRELRKKKG